MFGRLYLGINKITAYILHEQALNVVTPRLHVKQCWVQPITNMSVANKILILDTHESEQRPVAEEPMKMDSVLVHAYEQEANDADGVDQVRDEYSGSMAGVKSTYAPNMRVASNEKSGNRALAKNIAVGMRLPSFPVVNQADGSTIPLLNLMSSGGCWRLIVFSGDLRRPRVCERLTSFAESFTQHSHLAHQQQTESPQRRGPPLQTLLVHANPRMSISLLNLPIIFHPSDGELGRDYWKICR